MNARGSLALGIAAMVGAAFFVPACDEECLEDNDCAEGEICAFVAAYECVTPCSDADDCADGQTCVEKGSSCDGCDDLLRLCE